jgi:uncharacterized protein with NRDE domain
MCLIAVAYKAHPKFPLILMGNRDEFKNRPTMQAHDWEEPKGIIAGRDLKAGGTWLGVQEAGKVAVLTNYRDLSLPKKEYDHSRGKLIVDYLASDLDGQRYWAGVPGQAFEGFNMLLWNTAGLYYASNMGVSRWVKPGIHALSNHLLNTKWPKVDKARAAMESIIKSDQITAARAMDLLADREIATDPELPETGVPLEVERMLSSVFIDSPEYGTRCSTFFRMDNEGNWWFEEYTWESGNSFVKHGKWGF